MFATGRVPRGAPIHPSAPSKEAPELLEVTIYNERGEVQKTFTQAKGTEFDFVSLVSDETYGPPALVAPNKNGQGPRAAIEDRVLYINTHFIPMFAIERISD